MRSPGGLAAGSSGSSRSGTASAGCLRAWRLHILLAHPSPLLPAPGTLTPPPCLPACCSHSPAGAVGAEEGLGRHHPPARPEHLPRSRHLPLSLPQRVSSGAVAAVPQVRQWEAHSSWAPQPPGAHCHDLPRPGPGCRQGSRARLAACHPHVPAAGHCAGCRRRAVGRGASQASVWAAPPSSSWWWGPSCASSCWGWPVG